PSVGSPPATRSAASTPSTTTASSSRSPSAAHRRRSTPSPRRSAPRSPPSVERNSVIARLRLHREPSHDPARRSADAERTRDDDLREVEDRPPRRRAPRRRRRGDADRGPDPVEPAARRAAEPPRDRRAGDRPPLQPPQPPQLRPRLGLLPARLLHDEAQPAAERAGRGAARPRPPAPGAGPAPRPGRAGADVPAAGEPGGDLRTAQRQPAAFGRVPRRARRPAADPRLPCRSRRNADQGARPRHLTWDQ